MKKLIKTLALTLAAVLVFGLTVSAATSPSTATVSAVTQALANDASQIASDGGFGVAGTIGNLDEDWLARAQAYADAHGLGKVVTIFRFDSSAKNVNFSVRYANLKDNQEYSFLHYTGDVNNYDANAWEVIKATKSEGQRLTGFFVSFSPIGIVEGSASAAAVVAPKTGEVVTLAILMALMMIAGAVVCAKKARLQK